MGERAAAKPQAEWGRWARRAGRLSGYLMALAVLLALLAVIAYAALPRFDYKAKVISGGSMEPAVPLGSLIISRPAGAEVLRVGDVISFRYPGSRASVTHRIISIREENEERLFTVKGDANDAPDPREVRLQEGADRMVLVVPYAGYLVAFASSPSGLLLFVLVPAAALILLQIWGMGRSKGSEQPSPGVK